MNEKGLFEEIRGIEHRLRDIEHEMRGRRRHPHYGRTPKGTQPSVREFPKSKSRFRQANRH